MQWQRGLRSLASSGKDRRARQGANVGRGTDEQPSRAYGAKEQTKQGIYTSEHFLAWVDPQPAVQKRFDRAEWSVKKGGLPLEYPDQIKAHTPGQPDGMFLTPLRVATPPRYVFLGAMYAISPRRTVGCVVTPFI
jgi:hypothetical protein